MLRHNGLIVDPEPARRFRIKHAASILTGFDKIDQCSDLKEAMRRVKGEQRFDVIFLSVRLGEKEMVAFITEAKKLRQTQDAAFVTILEGSAQKQGTLVINMLAGADGQLFEPFSADMLNEIVELATKVKQERSFTRTAKALSMLINDIGGYLDLIADLRASGSEAKTSTKHLSEVCGILKTLDPDLTKYYLENAVLSFETRPAPLRKNYQGASKRVREKMEQAMASHLDPSKIADQLKREI